MYCITNTERKSAQLCFQYRPIFLLICLKFFEIQLIHGEVFRYEMSDNFLSFIYPYLIFSGQVGGYYSPYTGGFTAAQMAAAAAAAAAQQTTQVKF